MLGLLDSRRRVRRGRRGRRRRYGRRRSCDGLQRRQRLRVVHDDAELRLLRGHEHLRSRLLRRTCDRRMPRVGVLFEPMHRKRRTRGGVQRRVRLRELFGAERLRLVRLDEQLRARIVLRSRSRTMLPLGRRLASVHDVRICVVVRRLHLRARLRVVRRETGLRARQLERAERRLLLELDHRFEQLLHQQQPRLADRTGLQLGEHLRGLRVDERLRLVRFGERVHGRQLERTALRRVQRVGVFGERVQQPEPAERAEHFELHDLLVRRLRVAQRLRLVQRHRELRRRQLERTVERLVLRMDLHA